MITLPLVWLLSVFRQAQLSHWRERLLLSGAPVAVAQLAILANLPISADMFVLGINRIWFCLPAFYAARQMNSSMSRRTH